MKDIFSIRGKFNAVEINIKSLILLIYLKSTALDKNEQKKKIMLHKVKNSLSVIMGYSEAHSDDLITKEEFDKHVNEEIEEIVNIIKDEIYK